MTGIEPVTSSLPRKRSTSELHRLNIALSGRRDSNPRPSAWKADALPTELLPHAKINCQPEAKTTPPWWGKDSNLRRLSHQIYSLAPLTAREPHLIVRVSTRALTKELAVGLEPATCCLQSSCSTN